MLSQLGNLPEPRLVNQLQSQSVNLFYIYNRTLYKHILFRHFFLTSKMSLNPLKATAAGWLFIALGHTVSQKPLSTALPSSLLPI